MIISGKKEEFAIETEITHKADDYWIYGHLRFWFHGVPCGDWNDATHLRGCHGWLKDFVENQPNRYEEGLLEASPTVVFRRLVESILPYWRAHPNERVPEVYHDTGGRFHIDHLGMSSFNKVAMVLIESSKFQRCVWQDEQANVIHDDVFPSGHMQQIAGEYCKLLKDAVIPHGVKF